MKMYYGGVPVNSMKVRHYETSTNDATLKASDMQSGITAYARGEKITGTGKSFEFANYGAIYTNVATPIPSTINVIEVASLDYPVQHLIALNDMCNIDFSTSQAIGNVVIDGMAYPMTVIASSGQLTVSCEKTIKLEVFYGKDNYVI